MQHSGRIIVLTAVNQYIAEYVALTGITDNKCDITSLFGTSILTVKDNPRIVVLYCENFVLNFISEASP